MIAQRFHTTGTGSPALRRIAAAPLHANSANVFFNLWFRTTIIRDFDYLVVETFRDVSEKTTPALLLCLVV